ncbi:MAG: VCBS domain-containing protein, partial [Campylobacteraceae bacterium]|nr:VCBS domain-containing protein [Campylobacteraceae bacterium]
MAQVIGYVKSLQNGAFFAKDAHGEVRELKAGDQIFKDELVFGAQNNPQNAQVIIDVTLTDASDIVLSGVDQLYADISVIGGSFETEDAVVATDSLENAWKLSTNTTTPDTTTPLEATAAGIEAPAAGLTTADGDRPINGTFYDRTGLIGDVRTTLTQDTVNGGTSQTIARVDTQDYNEQPTVENVTGSVNEALNGLNQITGQLVASDPDAGDTHTFFAVDGSLLINGEPAPEGVVLVLNEDGTYSVTGDFNALAVGENAVITFQYYAVDDGLEIGETHTSLPATVTITIQGTNDQPVVSDISVNDSGSSEGGIVGYYDMASGQGVSAQVNGITSAGLTAAQLFTLSAEELANIGTLYVQNPSNSNYGSEYLSQLSAIQSAVSNGMTLIIHDRYVTEGSQILPGGESIVFHRLEGNGTNIEIIDSELETGASGNIDDSSLDNGSYSNHGYVDLTSLPEGATVLMTDGDPSHVVTFSYQYGAGTVIYSTIPLDHYLANSGNSGLNANMQIYAANLLEDFAKGNGTIYETRDSTDVIEVDDTTDDGRNVLSGALTVADDDATDTHTFSVVEGSLVIDDTASEAGITAENVNVSIVQVDGVWQYNIDGDFSELAAGEKVTITFQYVADDGEGFDGTDGVNENSVSEPKTITLTITGTNDQPVVENVTLVSQSEAIDGTNTFAGTLAATDADAHDTHEFFVVEESVSVDKEFIGIPSIELNSQTGEYTLTGDFNALAVGESVTVTFSYYAVDSSSTQANGESKTSEIKTVTMTITGTNDAPVLSGTTSGEATEAGNLDDGSVVPAVSATGTLVATDADHNATQTWSIDGDGVGTYGIFSIDANGNWTYTVDSTAGSAADKLKEGQSVTEQFTVIVTDDQGATDTQVVTITVRGTNDVPVAVADVNSVTEAGNGNFVGDIDMGSPIALGNLLANDSDVDNGSDIDVSKILSVGTSQSDTTPGWLFGNLDVQGSYGILVVNKETGLYAYALNNANGSVNALNEGDTLTDTFTYTVQDNNGAITTSTLTITINGTNDAPVISGKTFGMATEAGNYDNGIVKEATVATGTLIANDVDNDSVTWSIQGSATKTYGSLSIDADGHWTYTINDTTGSAADKLAEGQVRYETFTIIASDNNPINPKTDMQEVTITIKGTNDSPVITNASSALLGTVVEAGSNDDGSSVAGIATISGQLSASDVDNGATQKWSIVGTADTTYGTISINANTGKWTYTLNNTDTDTQALAEGESKTLNYTARVIDDKGAYVDQTITITISGTNDAPVLTSSTALSFSVAEDAAEADADKSYSGNIGIGSLATDVDHGAVLQIGKVNGVTVGIDGVDQMVTFTYTDKNGDPASFEASLHVNQDGTYTISTSNDLNPLPAGVNATASLNFTITDENGAQTAPKTVNLTITGDNDAPTTETITLKAIAEDSGALLITQADLLANANDVDNANLSATNFAISSGNGTLVDNGNGTWT